MEPTTRQAGGATLVSYDLGDNSHLSAYSAHPQFGTGAFVTRPAGEVGRANLFTRLAAYPDGSEQALYAVSQRAFAHSAVNFAVTGLDYADLVDEDGDPVALWLNEEWGNRGGDPWREQAAFAAGDYQRSAAGFVRWSGATLDGESLFFQRVTQAQYDAIAVKDPQVFYIIRG